VTECIPRAIGVPGLPQPPIWPGIAFDIWTSPPSEGYTVWPTGDDSRSKSVPRGLDDPRWQGALRHGQPQAVGAGEDATFRALYAQQEGQKRLFLSWHVRADGAPHPGDDVLWVGFERKAGNPLVIQIEPFSSGADKRSGPVSAVTALTLNPGSTTGTPLGSPPEWITKNTHAWFHPGTSRWAVQMSVPIDPGGGDGGLNLTDTFRMWYELTVRLPDDPTKTPPQQIVAHRWPYGAAVVSESGFPPETHVPALSAWDTFHLSTGSSDPVCPTTGFVSISLQDVGTTNSSASRINLNAATTFQARPLNRTGGTIPAGAVSAMFRIANWGSIADPLAPWDIVPTSGGTTNPATNAAAIPDGAKGSNTFTWTLNQTERDTFKPKGPRDTHQCILVELSGSGLAFRPSSVWRNMDFASASTLRRVAEINSVGLGPAAGGAAARDAYLLVEKLNMPAPGDGLDLGGGWAVGGPERPERPEPERPRVRDLDVPDPEQQALEEAAERLRTEEERLDATMPTYRVHTYHDTGETVLRGGTTYRVLTPATSFGYYVEHDGTPAGWNDDLVEAAEISPRFYRLSVPVEGTAQVTTVIEAVDRPGCLLAVPRLLWASLRALVSVIRRRFGP
jgi:hypothetical protein